MFLDNKNIMSFQVYTGSLNALQGIVARASYSQSSEFSANSQNTIGYQTLLYNKEVNLDFSSSSTQYLLIGSIPSNTLIYSAVCYSNGLTGTTDSGNIVVSGNIINSDLNMTIEGVSNGGVSLTLNRSLKYPNMVSGEFNPNNSTNPFTSALRDDPNSPTNLRLMFNWSGTSNLATLTGNIIVKIALQQMDPNNLPSDGYPTGGVRSGPVQGSTLLL